MSILLTEEQVKAELDARVTLFADGLKELKAKTQLDLIPKIRENGPTIELIDTKYEDKTA